MLNGGEEIGETSKITDKKAKVMSQYIATTEFLDNLPQRTHERDDRRTLKI